MTPSPGPPPEALKGFMKTIEWLIDGNKKTADEYKKLCNRVLILETINIGEGNTMADYIEDLKNTIAKAEDIRDSFNPRFEKIEKEIQDRKILEETSEKTLSDIVAKVEKIEECLKNIAEQSLSILKISANNTHTLINKLDDEKETQEIDLDAEGTGEA